MLMNPIDNAENLPQSYLDALDRLPTRQRNRFKLGIFGDEADNALWTQEIIDGSKVDSHPDLVRVVVAVDPSGASGNPDETNDDIGILVAGLGEDGVGYVLEDVTLKAGPKTWGGVAVSAYVRHDADILVAEVNYGGAMVELVIRAAASEQGTTVPYKSITASRSKMLRAEPISALHENGKIAFVGDFPDLEDEMLNATTAGYTGSRSPNRLDVFVFAMTELFPGMAKPVKREINANIPDNVPMFPQIRRHR
jgi:phage terminase large subunit-like protein